MLDDELFDPAVVDLLQLLDEEAARSGQLLLGGHDTHAPSINNVRASFGIAVPESGTRISEPLRCPWKGDSPMRKVAEAQRKVPAWASGNSGCVESERLVHLRGLCLLHTHDLCSSALQTGAGLEPLSLRDGVREVPEFAPTLIVVHFLDD